jgi:1-acyl-sn-glycerol-3-phosphate acyltransferase
MFSAIFPPSIVGLVTSIAVTSTIAATAVLLAPACLVKLIAIRSLQRACSHWCVGVAIGWVAVNRVLFRLLHAVQWQIDIRTPLDPAKNYLLISNHQSWADIILLLDVLHGRVPFPRFFLKHALIYVPVIGMACWGMDFPFMRRHSREKRAAHPELKGQDLEATRRACELYKTEPVTVINFLEGTRFSEAKRAARQSPYRHLLRPKAGGLSFTLNAMGEQFDGIIDVTIAYRPTRKSYLWSFASGEQDRLAVHIDVLPIPAELMHGDYENDAEFRARFQNWVNTLWARKDARLERMLGSHPAVQAQRPAAL